MNETVFILTDGCMWEQNKQNGTNHSHAIEVVDSATGAVRYIKSGSRIAFVEGEITETRSQETYNKMEGEMPNIRKGKLHRANRKEKGADKQIRKTKGL